MNKNFNQDEKIIETVEIAKDTYTSEVKTKRKHPFAKKIGVFMLSASLFGGVAGASLTGTSYLLNQSSTSATQSASSNSSTSTSANSASAASYTSSSTSIGTTGSTDTMSVSDVAANCMSSVVAITNISVSDVMTYWGSTQQESESCGSGVIIGQDDDELLIVTNYHVIEDSSTLTIVFSYDEDSDNPSAFEATVKGYDEDKDLAVIAVSTADLTDDVLSQISIASIGSSDDLSLGENVVAIGNALGYGQSVTSGVVSALNREITTSDDSDSSSSTTSSESTGTTNEYIQTDAAINPGNSGGALFNMNGELVGINSAKIASDDVEGMGYAIPISDVTDLIQDLINGTVNSSEDTTTETYTQDGSGDSSSQGQNGYTGAYGFGASQNQGGYSNF